MHESLRYTKLLLLITTLAVAACGGGEGGDASAPIPTAAVAPAGNVIVRVGGSVGGAVSGLAGKLVLQNNAGDDLTLTAEGDFVFTTALAEGSAYEVSVRTQPLWQFCTVSKSRGLVAAGYVDDVAVACSAKDAQVSTFAGSGIARFVAGLESYVLDGNGRFASFDQPNGVAIGPNGDLFVTEGASQLVRKITQNGDVTTFAGNTRSLKSSGAFNPSQDGNGKEASFSDPNGLALDATGNVYVTEGTGRFIRKITPAGDVTKFAGNGDRGTNNVDGHGISAEFKDPRSVASDAAGNLYVTEFWGSAVRKITPEGDVTTLAGSVSAGFNQAKGIVVDAAGNVYVADTGNHLIRKIMPNGVVTTLAGSGQSGATDGVGSAASFNMPEGLALDSDGNLFVADTGNHLLRKITSTGQVSTLAGQAGVAGEQNGIGAAASFDQPCAVAVDADGSLYVADSRNHLIRKISPIPMR